MNDPLIDEKISFLRRVFGSVYVPAGKGDPAVSCPKCRNSSKKKLAIKLTTDLCNCWVCGLHGRLITILVQYRPSYVHEYITKYAKSSSSIASVEPAAETRVVNLPDGFRLLASNASDPDPRIRDAISYLNSRGLSTRDLWYFKFGVADDPVMFRRVIMPSFDSEGTLNFYTGRSIESSSYKKYMNSIAEKKSIVFNELNIDWRSELTLVEGPFDLTKCDDNATCLLGSSLSEDSRLFHQIYKHGTPVLLALDSDMRMKTWQKIARMLASYDISVRILDLAGFKDVGEMSRSQFIEAKRLAQSWSRSEALLTKIKDMRV